MPAAAELWPSVRSEVLPHRFKRFPIRPLPNATLFSASARNDGSVRVDTGSAQLRKTGEVWSLLHLVDLVSRLWFRWEVACLFACFPRAHLGGRSRPRRFPSLHYHYLLPHPTLSRVHMEIHQSRQLLCATLSQRALHTELDDSTPTTQPCPTGGCSDRAT